MEMIREHPSVNETSLKFRVSCKEQITTQTPTTANWLTLSSLLAYTQGDLAIAKGLLNRTKEVVVKFGNISKLGIEYTTAEQLHTAKVPSIVKFFCVFTCKEDFKDVLKQNYKVRPEICHGPGETLACIVMPYFPMGSLALYPWKRHELPLLKNILKQVSFALLQAFEDTGFVHGDLHAGNVVLRKSKKSSISYRNAQLDVLGVVACVLDLESCTIGRFDAVKPMFDSIRKLIYTTSVSTESDLALDFTDTALKQWSEVTAGTYTELGKAIDSIVIRYAKSEIFMGEKRL